jgi:hypothetical protein
MPLIVSENGCSKSAVRQALNGVKEHGWFYVSSFYEGSLLILRKW